MQINFDSLSAASKDCATINQAEEILNDWCVNAPPAEMRQRNLAKSRIIDFLYRDAQGFLQLNGLKLTSLPEIFYLKDFHKLQSLYVYDNKLTQIPSLSNCINLKTIKADQNKLEVFPELSDCKKIEIIDASNNYLEVFPCISNCRNLRQLILSNNKLTELPSLKNSRQLYSLSINDNKLECLPDLSACENLQFLAMRCNQLAFFPDVSNCKELIKVSFYGNPFMGTMTQRTVEKLNNWCDSSLSLISKRANAKDRFLHFLENSTITTLFLNNMNLETLPEIFDDPDFKKLTKLDISFNKLRFLPNTLRQLPSSCQINIDKNLLSANIIKNVKKLWPNSLCQDICIDVVPEENNLNKLMQCDSDTLLFLIALRENEPTPILDEQLAKNGSFQIWLNHVYSHINNEMIPQHIRTSFSKKILKYINRTTVDDLFRHLFFVNIKEAENTYNDLMHRHFSIIRFGIDYAFVTVNKNNPRELFDTLQGIRALALLEQKAKEKASTCFFVESIDIYLAYCGKLKTLLNLPIELDDSLYFYSDHVSDKEADDARKYIEDALSDPEEFLITQEPWIEYLSSRYPQEIETLEQKKQEALMLADASLIEINNEFKEKPVLMQILTKDNSRKNSPVQSLYQQIDSFYNEGLLALTRQTLGEKQNNFFL